MGKSLKLHKEEKNETSHVSRRKFLGGLGTIGAAGIAGVVPAVATDVVAETVVEAAITATRKEQAFRIRVAAATSSPHFSCRQDARAAIASLRDSLQDCSYVVDASRAASKTYGISL